MEATTSNGLKTVIQEVTERARTLVRLEGELAAMEIRRKIASVGIGVGLLAASAVLLVYAIGFGFAAVAAALATFLPVWAGILIVAGGLALLAAAAAGLGVSRLKRGTPPIPEQAIAEAKATGEALKGNGRG